MRDNSKYAWFAVCLLLIVWMLNYLDRQVIFSIFPLLQNELHISSLQLGLLGSAFLWVYAFCSPWAGYFADRFGKKKIICASLLTWSLITALSAHVHTFSELLVLRSLMGVSEACYLPAGLALIAALHGPSTRSRAVSLHYSGTYLGTVLGGALGGWLGAHYGWRSALTVFGAAGILYAVVLMLMLRRDPSIPETQSITEENSLWSAFLLITRKPGFLPVLSVFVIASICDWAIYAWMPLYLFENFHYTLAKAGFAATFYPKAGGISGLLLGGYIADWWSRFSPRGRIWTQSIGLALAAPCLFLAARSSSSQALLAGMLGFGLGKAIYDGNIMPVLCDVVPGNLRATAFGILNLSGTFAGGVVAFFAGALKSRIGLDGTFLFCGSILLIAVPLMLRVRPHVSLAKE